MRNIDLAATRLRELYDHGAERERAIPAMQSEGFSKLLCVGAVAIVEQRPLIEALNVVKTLFVDPPDRSCEVALFDIETILETSSHRSTISKIFAEMAEIPWERVVHFYGRATDLPSCILNLSVDDDQIFQKALSELSCIEHQDSLVQASPLCVKFMLDVFPIVSDQHKPVLREFFGRLLDAATSVLEMSDDYNSEIEFDLSFVTQPKYLWPPYVNVTEEEIAWEEREFELVESLAWHVIVKDQLATETWAQESHGP